MSIPTSKILKASKAVMAIADLKASSPEQKQSQSVNIVVNPTYMDKKVSYPKTEANKETTVEQEQVSSQETEDNPYAGVQDSPMINTRDIESAMEKTKEIAENIQEKDNTIKALSLIIEIIQQNPLIVNKFVVAELDTLAELIRLLTNSECVEIDTEDIDCSCTSSKYRVVKRIYIKKDGDFYSVNQCPIILRLFDNYKISLNLVI